MLVCFFYHKGIVHYEIIAQRQMVNQQCYLGVLTKLQEFFGGRNLNSGLTVWAYIVITPLSVTLRFSEFLAKKSIAKLDHPPYSRDLSPFDFWVFSNLKNAPKGWRFVATLRSKAAWHYCAVFWKLSIIDLLSSDCKDRMNLGPFLTYMHTC
jgi:hypothetical protein